jgi:hypothetical protein
LNVLLGLSLSVLISVQAASLFAGEADVVGVEVRNVGNGQYRFDVTVAHLDEGWQHYADGWDVVAPDGTILGTRTLLHPHVEEQPFTRSLSGVAIPGTITEVTIRAHDSVHGYGGATVTKQLP